MLSFYEQNDAFETRVSEQLMLIYLFMRQGYQELSRKSEENNSFKI